MQRQRGFTLVEIAIVLVIIGLLLGGILRGQELIQGARVRNIIDQQNGVRAAYFGFQDRFRAIPGDLTVAQQAQIGSGVFVGTPGGDGVILANDSSSVFQNLTVTGFLSCGVCTVAASPSTAANSPINVYGGVMQVVTDNALASGTSTTSAAIQMNIKTGNVIPSNVLGEVDLKMDDGQPYTGSFVFSLWAAAAPFPTQATCANNPTATASAWNKGQPSGIGGVVGTNCGGATKL